MSGFLQKVARFLFYLLDELVSCAAGHQALSVAIVRLIWELQRNKSIHTLSAQVLMFIDDRDE